MAPTFACLAGAARVLIGDDETVSIDVLRRGRRRALSANLDGAATVNLALRRQEKIAGFIRFSALVAA